MATSKSIYFSPQAEFDLESIIAYTNTNWSFEQALKYSTEINESIQILGLNSELGQELDIDAYKYSTLVVQKHIVYYRIEGEKIIVVRILHLSVDRKRWLNTE